MSFLRQLMEKADNGELPLVKLPGASGATEGQVLEHDGAGGSAWKDRGGYLRQDAERLTTSTESGGTYVSYLTLTTPSGNPAGDYIISWWYVVQHSNTTGRTDVNVRVAPGSAGPVQDLNEPNFQSFTRNEFADASNVIEHFGSRRVTLNAGQQFIEIRHKQNLSGTSSLHDGAISIERASDP